MQVAIQSSQLKAALWGLFIGDAVAMPVHWYYDLRQLKKDFGAITKYEAPKERFPGSIMNLSNTGGAGRGSDKGSIIGDVINHGKKQYWEKGGQYHYHHGMKAGESTLEAMVVRQFMKSVVENGGYDASDIADRYIKFMTTPGTHNDVYAATAHRQFFSNHVQGKAPSDCADNDGHNTNSIDGLTVAIPLLLASVCKGDNTWKDAKSGVYFLRKSDPLVRTWTPLVGDMLKDILVSGNSAPEVANAVATQFRLKLSKTAPDPMSACYIDSSFPAALHFTYKYGDSMSDSVLANANAGGENVARGSLIGALVGASVGMEGIDTKWIDGLVYKDELEKEINAFVDHCMSCQAA